MAHPIRSFLPALALATLFPSSAAAFEHFTVGVGIHGQAGGNFIDEPDDQSVPEATAENGNPRPEYPGFAGMTSGFGPFIELRAIDYVGVEFGILFTTDSGSADIDITNLATQQTTTYEIEISHSAVHLPLLFKGTLPGPIVQPNLFVGPEFVIPSDAEINVDPSDASSNSYTVIADGETYTMVTFGMGLEFKLPIPVVDIRIPFSLRGSINPGVSSKRIERADHVVQGGVLTETSFKTEWKFQAVANLGASVHF